MLNNFDDMNKPDNISSFGRLQKTSIACDRSLTPNSKRVFQVRMKEEGEFNKVIRLKVGTTRPISKKLAEIQTKIHLETILTPQQIVLQESFKKYQEIIVKFGPSNTEIRRYSGISTDNSVTQPYLPSSIKQKDKKNCCFFL